jgi:hypothetical protein
MDLRETGCGSMDWIHLAQDRDQWKAYEHGDERSGYITFWEILSSIRKSWH